MNNLEKYYNYIVDDMINNTEISSSRSPVDGVLEVAILFPYFLNEYYYVKREIINLLEVIHWDKERDLIDKYIIGKYGIKWNEIDEVIDRYSEKLSRIILDKYF